MTANSNTVPTCVFNGPIIHSLRFNCASTAEKQESYSCVRNEERTVCVEGLVEVDDTCSRIVTETVDDMCDEPYTEEVGFLKITNLHKKVDPYIRRSARMSPTQSNTSPEFCRNAQRKKSTSQRCASSQVNRLKSTRVKKQSTEKSVSRNMPAKNP